jgi:hypothetical protein
MIFMKYMAKNWQFWRRLCDRFLDI